MAAGELGLTARQALGVREIRRLLAGEITVPECIAAIQQATRRYAKRQLTWFRRQSNFEPLNLSHRSTAEAIELITHKARQSGSGLSAECLQCRGPQVSRISAVQALPERVFGTRVPQRGQETN